jgi:hypothetical protein
VSKGDTGTAGRGQTKNNADAAASSVVSFAYMSLYTYIRVTKGGYTFVTLPSIVTPYRDSVEGTRDRVTYQKLLTR